MNSENQNSYPQEAVQTPPQAPEVGFPMSAPKPKAGINKWIFVLIGLLILGVGGVFLFTQGSQNAEEPTPVPTFEAVETASPTPAATPLAADRSKVKIEVQNGTGITGEASYLATQLKSLGYTNVKAGNAENQDYTITEVTFNKSVSLSIQDEITKKLETLYQKVEVKSSSTQTMDVVIISGLKKGATAKPSATPTAKASATPTSKASASPTGSASPTPATD